MAESVISFTGAMEMMWHIGAWGFAIVLAALWMWELSASQRLAKAQRSLQDWSSNEHATSEDRFKAKATDLPLSAKLHSDVLSRISKPVAVRNG